MNKKLMFAALGYLLLLAALEFALDAGIAAMIVGDCRSNVSLASVKARVQKAQFDSMRRASDLHRATRAGRDRKAETVQFNDRSDQT
jgi:hypothetical protein